MEVVLTLFNTSQRNKSVGMLFFKGNVGISQVYPQKKKKIWKFAKIV